VDHLSDMDYSLKWIAAAKMRAMAFPRPWGVYGDLCAPERAV